MAHSSSKLTGLMTTYTSEAWEEFARAIIPPEAHSIQVHEMQKAFYGGLQSMLNIQDQILEKLEHATEDEQGQELEKVYNEIEAFFAMMPGIKLQ